MRIGILMFDYLPKIGGAQICAHCIADSFVKLGHEVFVYANSESVRACRLKGWRFDYEIRGVNKYPTKLLNKCSWLGKKLLAEQIQQCVERDQLGVMQIVFSWPWLAAVPKVKSQIPVVLRCAGDDIQVDHSVGYGIQRESKIRNMQRIGFRSVDKSIAISDSVRSEYLRAGMSDKDIVTIPPGVDIDAFESCLVDRKEIRKKWGIPTKKKLIIGVGRNHHKKRFQDLVRSLVYLNDESEKYVVSVIGNRSCDLVDVARKAGVSDSFFPIDELADISVGDPGTFPSRKLIELYKTADYFVHPSAIETYANVALEAMAAGVPVVVTDAPGNRDTVCDGVDGLIVNVGSPREIAEKIKYLDSNEWMAAKLTRNGRDKAIRQDWTEIAIQYIKLYQSLEIN